VELHRRSGFALLQTGDCRYEHTTSHIREAPVIAMSKPVSARPSAIAGPKDPTHDAVLTVTIFMRYLAISEGPAVVYYRNLFE
jgi:hypothetical protein